jgi:hypothetical protein
MNNTDLFEKPFYTVHVNGLFGLTTKASVTKKFTDRSNTAEGLSRRIMGYTGQAGMEQFEQAMRDSFRDQLMTGSSSVYVGLNSDGTTIIQSTGSVAVGQSPLGTTTTNTYSTSVGSGSEDRRRLVLNTLQRQLQQGEISVMDYLDLISQQE